MEVVRWACVHFVSIRGQKIRKNIKTNEKKRKNKISCFQALSVHLLETKQVTKTAGHESLLPSHSDNELYILKIRHFLAFPKVGNHKQKWAKIGIFCGISWHFYATGGTS